MITNVLLREKRDKARLKKEQLREKIKQVEVAKIVKEVIEKTVTEAERKNRTARSLKKTTWVTEKQAKTSTKKRRRSCTPEERSVRKREKFEMEKREGKDQKTIRQAAEVQVNTSGRVKEGGHPHLLRIRKEEKVEERQTDRRKKIKSKGRDDIQGGGKFQNIRKNVQEQGRKEGRRQ